MTTETKTANILNGVNVSALGETIKAMSNDLQMGQAKFRVVNRWNSGASNTATVQGFYAAHQEIKHKHEVVIEADEPPLLLGNDNGANPVETLLAALSGCMTTTLVYKSAAHGYKIDGVQSSYEGDIDLNGLLEVAKVNEGFNEIRVKFKVKGDTPKELIEKIVKTSPVYDTLRRPITIKIDVEKF